MHAVVKKPEVPGESQGPLLTLPPCPLPRGTGAKRKRARSFLAGAGARLRRRARAARAAPPAGSAAGRRHRRLWEGIPGRPGSEPGPASRPPLNPRCSAAARTAARPSPLAQHQQPPIPVWAWRDRHSPALPPRFPAEGRAASLTIHTQLVSPAGTHTPLLCEATPASGELPPSTRCCLH